MSTDGQRINTAENFDRLSRVHERYRQTTGGRAIAYSERTAKVNVSSRKSPFTQLFKTHRGDVS